MVRSVKGVNLKPWCREQDIHHGQYTQRPQVIASLFESSPSPSPSLSPWCLLTLREKSAVFQSDYQSVSQSISQSETMEDQWTYIASTFDNCS
jgi:hypothetical protein